MSSKHARLVAAVSDAKEAQGFTWKQIATMGGVSQGCISSAINQGVTMKDERWKMICEGLGLDYDDIVADIQRHSEKPVEAPAPSEKLDEPVKVTTNETYIERTDKEDRDNLFLLAMYAEGRISKDIEAGMKVDPMKLWGILDALKKIKDSTLQPE